MTTNLSGNQDKKENIQVSVLILRMAFFLYPPPQKKRIEKFWVLLDSIMESLYPTARMATRLVGTVNSMGLGIGPIGKLHTGMLYSDICRAPFLDEKVKLSNEALEELLFWKPCCGQFNGQPIWLVPPDVAVITYSDASATGWGGFSVNVKGIMAKGNFTAEESEGSSIFRELKAMLFVLQS